MDCSPWNSPGQNTGVGSRSLLQGIFPTQKSNQGVLHCWWILLSLQQFYFGGEFLDFCYIWIFVWSIILNILYIYIYIYIYTHKINLNLRHTQHFKIYHPVLIYRNILYDQVTLISVHWLINRYRWDFGLWNSSSSGQLTVLVVIFYFSLSINTLLQGHIYWNIYLIHWATLNMHLLTQRHYALYSH